MAFESGGSAIVGLGLTPMTRKYTKPAPALAAEAIMAAVEDAGLEKQDLDGLLVNVGMSGNVDLLALQTSMGLRDLRLGTNMSAGDRPRARSSSTPRWRCRRGSPPPWPASMRTLPLPSGKKDRTPTGCGQAAAGPA